MKFELLGVKTVIIGIAFVAGIAIGTVSIHNTNVQAGAKHVFQKNQTGQTYGSRLDATSPETEPDLISAIGVNGIEGYVKRTDLEQGFPKTPEEAAALTKKGSPGREIPVYAVDGNTVADKFIAGGYESAE